MIDRENAITHLQIISTWASFARENDLQLFTEKHLEDMEQWANDAIALLKEDCHNCKLECLLQKYDELKEKYDALLKEQPEIIRCKDCKHRYKGWCCAKHHVLEEVKSDFFCGDGEQKE